MTDIEKYWKYIQIGIREEGIASLLMLIMTAIICILGYIIELPPYITLLAVTIVFIVGVIWGYKQAEKRKSNEAIKILKNRLEDFSKNFLSGGESDSFFSLSKNPSKKEYPDELWKKYHEWRFKHLELEVKHINEQIIGSILNEQGIRRCFIDLFTATTRCYAFLDEYVREINEQGNLTKEHNEIISVYHKFIYALVEDDRSLDTHAGIQLSKIRL